MVLAYHVIFGTYGFWLPNDPRGSWSDFVRAWELFRAGGPATARRSVARKSHDAEARRHTKQALTYPPVVLTGEQALSVAHGFAEVVAKSRCVIHACSILPEHVHLVIARHRYRVETVVRLLKAAATRHLTIDGRHPLAAWPGPDGAPPSPWAARCWKVFLNTPADVGRAIRYADDNPLKEGKRRQAWSFVVPLSPGSENRARRTMPGE